MATVEREAGALESRAQYWEDDQLVIVRKLGRTLARERYTLSPDRSRLHATVDVAYDGRAPVTYVRWYLRAARIE